MSSSSVPTADTHPPPLPTHTQFKRGMHSKFHLGIVAFRLYLYCTVRISTEPCVCMYSSLLGVHLTVVSTTPFRLCRCVILCTMTRRDHSEYRIPDLIECHACHPKYSTCRWLQLIISSFLREKISLIPNPPPFKKCR